MRLGMTVRTDWRFEVESTHRAYALRDGRYVDTHAMARVVRKP